jgi:hypothetical protein
LGYRGEGVRVAVLDTGVDFAHTDLSGTWAVLPPGHPDAGWPQAYDPYGTYFYVLDHVPGGGTDFTGTGYGGLVKLGQEASVLEQTVGDETKRTACLRPLVWQDPDADERVLGPEDCDTRVPASRSGRVRYGHHPDVFLAGLNQADEDPAAEFVGVLLVDATTAGVYDTVYIDLDGDHDFAEEAPLTRESPLSAKDVDGDGLADISGGLLYYIADGRRAPPGGWLWGPADVTPGAGSYVGLMVDLGEHGTLCASNIVSQGRLGIPPGVALGFRDLPAGEPAALNPALAPDARLVAIGDLYGPDVLFQSAWRYAVFGNERSRSDDDIQVTSNSYGWEEVENEGWDERSRYIDHYVRTYNPALTFVMATGNGAPGYGTVNSPLPVTGVAAGGATQHGQSGTDSITDTLQITHGDVTAFSDRGPASDGRLGVDVVADGASGIGAEPLNMVYDPASARGGAEALVSWQGTSRSAPVVAGALALVYQAYRAAHGRWPDWQTARGLLMGGARFNGYDAFTSGAGTLDAGDAVRLAAGRGGLFASPERWLPGDYRGQSYPAFAHLLRPGQTDSQRITFTNASDLPVEATAVVKTLRRISFYEGQLVTDLAAESPYSPNVPDYLVSVERNRVPNGTDLMVVRFVYPLSELDPDGDLYADNDLRPGVLQHTDIDGDGQLWDDADGNGVVNHATLEDSLSGLNGDPAVDWSATELDRWEYARFDRSSAETDSAAVSVHHPLERWKDGLYIALWDRRPGEPDASTRLPALHLRYRVEFYSYADWPWIGLSRNRLTIPPRGAVDLSATVSVPREAVPGAYQGAIFLDYARPAGDRPIPTGGGYELPERRLTVPVGLHVSARYDWAGSLTLGNSAATPGDLPYHNGAVRGMFDWGWRKESGDWRTFFLDNPSPPPPGTWWLVRTAWSDPSRHQTDLDTRLFGPAADTSAGSGETAWLGPYSLAKIGGSDERWLGDGRWRFDTATGTNEDWLAAPAAGWTAEDGRRDGGLTAVMLQNVLYSGAQLEVPFTTEVSSLRLEPAELVLRHSMCHRVTVTPQLDLTGLAVRAIGLAGAPRELLGQAVTQDDPSDVATASLRQAVEVRGEAASFSVTLDGPPAADLDLYLLRDGDGDGQVTYPDDVVGSSASGGPDESVRLAGIQPAGHYEAWVHGYRVPGGEDEADVVIDVVDGQAVSVKDVPAEIRAGESAGFTVCATDIAGQPSGARGVLVLGPGRAPNAIRVPFTWDSRRPTEVLLPLLMNDHFLPRR